MVRGIFGEAGIFAVLEDLDGVECGEDGLGFGDAGLIGGGGLLDFGAEEAFGLEGA